VNSRTLTGLLLVVGPVVTLAGWICLGMIVAMPDPEVPVTDILKDWGAEPGLVKTFISIATLATFLAVAGFAGLSRMMAGGRGSHYVSVGLILYSFGAVLGAGEAAFMIEAAEVSSGGNLVFGEVLYAASGSFGSIGIGTYLFGLGVIGFGLLIQKNVNIIIGALTFIVGIFGGVLSFVDYESPMIIIPYIGNTILPAVVGIIILSGKDSTSEE